MHRLHSLLCVLPALLLVLPSAIASSAATPYLLGLSTGAHFAYTPDNLVDHSSSISSSVLPALLRALRQPDTKDSNELNLPLSSSTSAAAPSVVLLAHSLPASLLPRVRAAMPALAPSGSAFSAASDGAVGDSLLHVLGAQSIASVDDLAARAGKPLDQVVDVAVHDENDLDKLSQLIPVLAVHAPDGIAVLFSIAAPEDLSLKPAARQEVANVTDSNSTVTEQEQGQGMIPEGDMLPPQIDAPQVAGILVGFFFLLIFIPGFMCLWRIQTPQTFAILDSNDMKKKLQ